MLVPPDSAKGVANGTGTGAAGAKSTSSGSTTTTTNDGSSTEGSKTTQVLASVGSWALATGSLLYKKATTKEEEKKIGDLPNKPITSASTRKCSDILHW